MQMSKNMRKTSQYYKLMKMWLMNDKETKVSVPNKTWSWLCQNAYFFWGTEEDVGRQTYSRVLKMASLLLKHSVNHHQKEEYPKTGGWQMVLQWEMCTDLPADGFYLSTWGNYWIIIPDKLTDFLEEKKLVKSNQLVSPIYRNFPKILYNSCDKKNSLWLRLQWSLARVHVQYCSLLTEMVSI